ncbi:MAG TPA: rhodanese-like domain-containing protein, partial [Methanoculleus sp.]|nr:rhodanese-like domain-containing protein [Methanoculleus sp.]
SLMDDANPALFKSNDELDSILEGHGVDRFRTVICTCGTGREATNEFVLLKWLYRYPNVRLYEGSITEWTRYPDNPVVTGPRAREERTEAAPAR